MGPYEIIIGSSGSIAFIFSIYMIIKAVAKKQKDKEKSMGEPTTQQQEIKDLCEEFLLKLQELVPPARSTYSMEGTRLYVQMLYRNANHTPTYDYPEAKE